MSWKHHEPSVASTRVPPQSSRGSQGTDALSVPTVSASSGAQVLLEVGGEGSRRASQPTCRFDYIAPEVRPLPQPLRCLRGCAFNIFMTLIFGGSGVFLLVAYFDEHLRPDFPMYAKYISIPTLSVIFTMWHVWLGIQMCWYPVEFKGIPPCLGWQGIVPRRASVLAGRACDIMIGRLITVEEMIDRIDPDDFYTTLREVLSAACGGVLERLAMKHCPVIWGQLPESVKRELRERVVEESRNMFYPTINDIKSNIHEIFDIKQMAIDSLVKDKQLLVNMFREIGRREFVFVIHVAGVMGFLLGCLQCVSYCYMPTAFWLLPISGLVIGYFTNWLAITMIFKPVFPHILCGGYVNFQGVFLKRQKEVSMDITRMMCTHLVHARKMLEFAMTSPNFDQALDIFQRNTHVAVENTLGRVKVVLPVFVGRNAIQGIKEDAMNEFLAELPAHSKEIEEYMDRAFALPETLGPRLAGLPPDQFEGMLHAVFQQDEWMVLLLGGVLGILVGSVQAACLRS